MEEIFQDRLTHRLDIALGEARIARSVLLDDVVPNLPPLRRIGAERIVRQIDRSEIVGPTLLDEIDTVAALAERKAEAGTHRGWESDDQDDHPGWPTLHRDARADALAAAAATLRRIHAAISAVLDIVEADRLAVRPSEDT